MLVKAAWRKLKRNTALIDCARSARNFFSLIWLSNRRWYLGNERWQMMTLSMEEDHSNKRWWLMTSAVEDDVRQQRWWKMTSAMEDDRRWPMDQKVFDDNIANKRQCHNRRWHCGQKVTSPTEDNIMHHWQKMTSTTKENIATEDDFTTTVTLQLWRDAVLVLRIHTCSHSCLIG